MNLPIGFDKCLTFINCHMKPAPGGRGGAHPEGKEFRWRAVTISRESGSGAHVVAEKLLENLNQFPDGLMGKWAIFDKNLVEKVIEDHHLPKRLAQFLREDRASQLSDTLDELFGLHPPTEELVRKCADTVLQLSDLSRVIIIGRGGAVITAQMPHVLHVRLIAPLDERIKYLQQVTGRNEKAALHLIHEEDGARRRYLKRYFGKNIDDPLLYHMVLNTHQLGYDGAAKAITHTLQTEMALETVV